MQLVKALLICIIIFVSGPVFSQMQNDSIFIMKSGMSLDFMHHDVELKPGEMLSIMSANPEAYSQMKLAKSKRDIGLLCGITGGFMVGWTIGTAMGGGDPNWVIGGVGLGLLVAAIPLSSSFTFHARKAAAIYNRGLAKTGWKENLFKVGLSINSVSVAVSF